MNSKKFIFLTFFLVCQWAMSQVKIGENPNQINSASIVELESTTKAFVLTRVTSAQMLAIRPLRGALVYNTENDCVFYYTGSQWVDLCNASTPGGSFTFVDNNNGTFTINYSDGTSFTSSDLTGPAGPAGADGAVGPQGPAGLNGTDGADGVDGAVGPQGPIGPVGPAGADGADGAVGPQGPAGLNGTDGADGAVGPQGPIGPAGADGMDGAVGPQGIQGDPGPQGPIGPVGPSGADGVDGAVGPQGADGLDGAQGPVGPVGPQGIQGDPGPQGPAGLNGTDGADGVDGAVGPQGPIGPVGPAGADGVDGAVGPQGPIGPVGPAGADGIDGAVGPQGPVGPAGADGVDGAVGPAGPQGPTGPQGPQGDPATNITTNLAQNTGTGIITYTNEEATAQTANVVGAESDNSISVGANGGAYYESPIKAFGKIASSGAITRATTGITVTKLSGNGHYRVNLPSGLVSDANYIIQLSQPGRGGTGNDDPGIAYENQTSTSFEVIIGDNDNGGTDRARYNSEFMFTVLDL
ncbi:MAG: hypothetical protein WBM55_07615 [Muriicola sp.]